MNIIRKLESKRVKRPKGAKKDEDGGKKRQRAHKVIFLWDVEEGGSALLLFRDTKKTRDYVIHTKGLDDVNFPWD